jgi:diguanylate cyclase (GGDEF)-like protein
VILVRGLTLLLALLAGCVFADAPASVNAGKFVLRDSSELHRAPLPLNGVWHFFPGRWVAPAQLDNVAADAQSATVPGAWQAAGLATGVQNSGADKPAKLATYWLEVMIDSPVPNPSIVYFRHFCGASAIYFFRDGAPSKTPLARSGQPSTKAADEQPSGGDLLAMLPPLQPGLYHLLVQQSSFQSRSGGLCGAVTIGDASVQEHAQALQVIKNTVVVALLLGLALGALVLGSQDGEKAAPWLALVFTACAILIACTGGLLDTLLGPANVAHAQWRVSLCYAALIWVPSGLLMLFRDTFNMRVPRVLCVVALAIPALLTLVLAIGPKLLTPLPKILMAWLAVQYALAYVVLFQACRQRRRHALLIALANIPLPIAMAYDYYQFFYNGRLEIISPYAIAFLIVIHGIIYTLKLGAAYQLAARLSTHLQEEVEQSTKELRDKNQKLEQAQTALQRANESLRVLSITDGLTQVHNRMYFEQQFEQEWRRCARQGLALSVLMIDADHFKKLNDSAGHLIGDLCLRAIARAIQQHFKRAGELVARYGGEEFIVLLPDTNQNKAIAVAESLRLAIENLIVEQTDQRYRITISIGVSTTTPALEQQPSQLLATADAALYEAKEAGRNRVHSIPLVSARRTMAQQQLHL